MCIMVLTKSSQLPEVAVASMQLDFGKKGCLASRQSCVSETLTRGTRVGVSSSLLLHSLLLFSTSTGRECGDGRDGGRAHLVRS